MVRCVRRRVAEIPMLLFSVLACLLFVVSLVDTRRVELEWVQAPAPPLPEEARDARLTVVVVQRGAGPLEGATVQAFWENDRRYFWAGAELSDDARSRRARAAAAWCALDPRRRTRASACLGASMSVRARRKLELELDDEQRLAVRVVDDEGAPIARATVLVTSRDPLPFGALTDADGRVTVGRLPSSPWTVKASAPGYESVERASVQGSVEIPLRRLGSLRVEVRDPAGNPAAGAVVSIAGSSLRPARRTGSRTRRRRQDSGLLGGAYDLRATLGSLASPPFIGYELARGANESLTLVLEQGRMVTAVVTDGEGPNPVLVPGADVVLAEGGLGSFPLRGRTGTDGTVVLGPVSPGPATLAARARASSAARSSRYPTSSASPCACRSCAAQPCAGRSWTVAASRSTAPASRSSALICAACPSQRHRSPIAFRALTSRGRWAARSR